MRKRIVFMTAGVLAGLVFGGAGDMHMVRAAQTEQYQYEQMELLQEGDVVIPEEDYSFDKEEMERIHTYLAESDTGETMDKDADKRTAAIQARANDNATLAERKSLCAAALYAGMTGMERRIQVAQFALSREEFKEVISDVVNSNPELFYIQNGYKVRVFSLLDDEKTEIVDYCQGFYEYQDNNGYPLTDKIAGLIGEVEQKRTEILSNLIEAGMTDMEKTLQIHEYLILTTQYDKAASDLYDLDHDLKHFADSDYDIYGTLVNGQAVCQGYALTFKYLMEAAGVENVGFASNVNHVWNTVTLKSGSYYVDCTWDDPSWDTLGNAGHRYFLKNDDNFTGHGNFQSDRTCDGTAYDNMFWDGVESGIFYYKGSYYYLADKGVLYKKKLQTNTQLAAKSEVVTTFDLKDSGSWKAEGDAKIALADPYILYHDAKDIYLYDLKTGKTSLLYEPELPENEAIYGVSYQNGQFLYATRMQKETQQNIYSYDLPIELFYIPVETVTIRGAETIAMQMQDGKLVSEDVNLRTTVQPENATDRRIRKWTSSDTSIAVIDINGRVKALAPGTVTITAQSYDGVTGTCVIQIVLEGAITDPLGDTVYYEDGEKVVDQFYEVDGKTYYLGSDGKKVTGWQTIEGNRYYFNQDGQYVTGWQTIDGSRYYFNENGIMISVGWQSVNGSMRYLSESGATLTGWQLLNGNRYYFNEKGDMVTGWQLVGGNWYYFDQNGVMAASGWQSVNGKLRYLNENGIMLTGWQKLGGNQYYFMGNGDMVTGWQTIGGKQYYFNSNGVMQTGFLKIKKKTYYFNSRGVMQTGFKKISKKTYYFNKKGVMQTGFKKIKKKTYYFNKKGVMQTGFKKIKNKTYYFNKKGVMQTGWKKIQNKTYYFNKKGVMLTGLQIIKGISYYFAPDGHFVS